MKSNFTCSKRMIARVTQLLIIAIFFCAHTASAADIQPVSFTSSPDPVPASGTVQYAVVFQNNQPSDPAINPRLEVDIPTGFTFLSSDDPDCKENLVGDKVVCDNIPTNSAQYPVNIDMQASAIPGTYTVYATGFADNDINPANNSEEIKTDVVESADLELTSKIGTPSPIPASGIVTYRFEVKNNGPFDSKQLSVTDALPSTLSFVADDAQTPADDDALWACSAIGQDVTCLKDSLAVGANSFFSFRVKVTSDTTGSIANAATIPTDLELPDPKHGNNTTSGDIEVIAGTDMSITKSLLDPTQPVIGGLPVKFRLTVTNEGPMLATAVKVVDTLPGGYTGISAAPNPLSNDWNCSFIVGTEITCEGPNMAMGATVDIIVTATPPVIDPPPCPSQPVMHQNTAQVLTVTADPIIDNDYATITYEVGANTADLSTSKSKSPSPAAPDQMVESTIIISNEGPLDTTQPLTVTDVLSPNETWQGYSGTDWNCNHDGGATPATSPGGTVTCTYAIVPLPAGNDAPTLIIETQATGTGDMTNTACVTSPDDTRDCNNCSGGDAISTEHWADVVVNKLILPPSDSILEEDEDSFTYTITIRNDGPDTAESVDFRDTIPLYVHAGPSGSGRPATTITATTDQGNCTISTALVHCDLLDILNGQTVTVEITVTRPMEDGVDITNTASAYSTKTGDPVRGNNEDSVDVTIVPVTDIEVTEKQVTPNPVLAGTDATYTIHVRNNGPSIAENVIITDTFTGEAFTYINSSVAGGGSCSFTSPVLTCNLGDMNPDTIDSITVVIRPTQLTVDPLPSPWEIGNTATASTNTEDSNPNNDSKHIDLTVEKGETDLALEKNESPVFSEPIHYDPLGGEPNHIVYEIVISNRGPSLATGVYFDDHVSSVTPAQAPSQRLKYIRDTTLNTGVSDGVNICNWPPDTEFDVVGNLSVLKCTLPNPIPSGGSYTHYLVFEVLTPPDAIVGDSYHNEAVVHGHEVDTNFANNEENENTTVRTIVDLGLVKDGPTNPVEVGEHFDFTLTVTNHGPGRSPLTVVTDALPTGMELTGTPTSTDLDVSCTGDAGDSSFFCFIDNVNDSPNVIDIMEPSETVTITVPVKLTAYPPGGCVTNLAEVGGQAPEPFIDPHPNTDDHVVCAYEPVELGDYVWLDGNTADGLQGGSESALSGVIVNLLDAAGARATDPRTGSPYTSITTDSTGGYSFDIYNAGSYIVEFLKPDASYLPSPQNTGGDDTVDSDAAPGNGRTAPIAFSHHATDPVIVSNDDSVDAGFYQLVSVGNRVWEDLNADGIQDSGELNIPGVTVELLDSGFAVLDTQITNATGEYIFTNLDPGDYYVQITPTSWIGYLESPVQTADANTDIDTDSNIASSPAAGTHRSGAITLYSHGEPTSDGDDFNSNLTLDFGLVLPGSIGNTVWLDENYDGIQDAGEPGLANITVQLFDNSGALIATTITDTNGGYLFSDLAPADYFIHVDETPLLAAGMSQTSNYPNPGADFANQDQSQSHGYGVHLTSNGENLTADFGYNWVSGAIGDRIWIDSNGNGVQDADETGVSGVEVTLYTAGSDGLFWTGDEVTVATVDTDAAGNYIFSGLSAGVYGVEVTSSATASHDVMTVASYGRTGDPDHFAADRSTAPAGTTGDNRTTLPIILAPGDTFINADFGYQPEAITLLYDIGDTVWHDVDRNGTINGTETIIPGVTIGLQNAAGIFIATSTTDSSGQYLFMDLPDALAYTVVVIDSDNVLAEMNITYDRDSGTANPDGKSTLTLASADDFAQDFGYAPNSPSGETGVIGDTIFLDADNNGTFDPGEGMEGVRVLLYDTTTGGNLIATTYTDENGNYLFGGLAAGDYRVEVDTTTLPPGLDNTVDPNGGNDSVSTLTLAAAGAINLAQDFGYHATTPRTIGDLVWQDVNADGVRQPDGMDGTNATADDETPFAGVTMDLYFDSNANGKIDPGEPRLASTVTDATGNYLFSGLPAASYNVKVTDTANILAGHWHSTGTAGDDDNSQLEYYPVVLPVGTDIDYADFGYYSKPGSLGDRVFKDEDVNGLYSGSDSPIAGIPVFLDIEYPDGTQITAQTITDASGLYLFPNLLLDERYNGIGSNYGSGGDEPSHTIRPDETTITPTGLIAIWASRGSNTDSNTVGGSAADEDDTDMGSDNPAGEQGYPPMGSPEITNDFGYFEPGSIGDLIWNDANNNGTYEAGEELANIDVQLTPPANVDLGSGLGTPLTISTNASGIYLFSGLPPGDYTVTVVESTLPDYLRGNNTINPDGRNDSISEPTLSVTSGKVADDLDQDFAYYTPAAIGDLVWLDTNGNGIQDSGEPGLSNVEVTLYDDNDIQIGLPVSTDSNGNYAFIDLLPGNYYVKFTSPVNYVFTTQNQGTDNAKDSDANPADGTTVTTNLIQGENDTRWDAGLYQYSSLGNLVWNDVNGNGVQDDGVSVRPGVTVTLYDNAGTTVGSTTTVADGTYGFSSLPPGRYSVSFSNLPASYVFSPQDQGGDNAKDSDVDASGKTANITLTSGQNDPTWDAGIFRPASIGDRVWEDSNGNGIQDNGENGVSGVTVTLYNSGGTQVGGTVTTNLTGNYSFTGLMLGAYSIGFTLPSGYAFTAIDQGGNDTADSDANPVDGKTATTVLTENENDTSWDAGIYQYGSLGDLVWNDVNGNGIQEAGESGVENVTVTLYDSNDNPVGTPATTTTTGAYNFSNLVPADYYVIFSNLPATYVFSEADQSSDDIDSDADAAGKTTITSITSGEIDTTWDAGIYIPASIGDMVWRDSNGNGVQDVTEIGVDGINVELFYNGTSLISTTTAGGGLYNFTDLIPGSYYVVFSGLPGSDIFTHHTTGTDNAIDSDADRSSGQTAPITLAQGTNDDTWDAGIITPASFGNYVWRDSNGNGVQDTAEAGVNGINVELFYNGTPLASTTTASNGSYSFTQLIPGSYYVEFSGLPAGDLFTNNDQGTNNNVDSDANRNTGQTPATALTEGENDNSWDAGLITPGSIGDTIWHDLNNNGLFDTGEELAGIDVILTPRADIDLGNGAGVAITVTTDTAGKYLFTGLPAGDFTVTVDESALPVVLQGANTVDPDGGNDSIATIILTATSGNVENNLDQDFAYFVPSTVGDVVWDDSNANGIQDGNESGHLGISVNLLDAGGSPVEDPRFPGTDYIVITNSAGGYVFTDLLPGMYQLQFDLPAGTILTSQDSGTDDSLDSDPDPADNNRVTVILGPSETNMSIDAGLVGPAIHIEKATNGDDADSAPGVSLNEGDAITWTYVVTNTGNVALTNVHVEDNRLGTISCPKKNLASGDTMTCSANGTAVIGKYENIATAIGSPPSGPAVIDADPSHYFGMTNTPAIDIEKATNGLDADTGTGPIISIGDPVTWIYVVTNAGNEDLLNVAVTDNIIGPITCPDNTLTIGASMTCTAMGIATAGQYENLGTVTATPSAGGADVTDTDPSHYLGWDPLDDIAKIEIEKATNGYDADSAPGPFAENGHSVIWTYVVTNTGEADLFNVTITDNQLADTDIHCPYDGNLDNRITNMPRQTSVTCVASGIAVAGQYENTGYVVGTPLVGKKVTDNDPSHYFGNNGSIDIEKYTNGEDADVEKGPAISVGRDVFWTYEVTNTGDFPLSNITVSDDMGVSVDCPKDNLASGEILTCTAQGVAVKGQYVNIGSVTATTPAGELVSDTDPSHYLGKSFMFIIPGPCSTMPISCYMIADRNTYTPNDSPLLKYTFREDKLEVTNWLGVHDVETMTFSLDGKTLYATDGGVLGTIDLTPGMNGSFTAIDPAGIGYGEGAYGSVIFRDIDGLAFDPETGILFGTERFREAHPAYLDLLVKIDAASGHIIKNGFGAGVDYVIINTKDAGVKDADDIAFDYRTGLLYGIAGISGGGGQDQGLVIDKDTGDVSLHAPLLDPNGDPVQDMEGFTVYNHRYFYGTTGIEFPNLGTSNMLYRIDKTTGESKVITSLKRAIDGFETSDIEAISCLPVCK